MPTESMKERVQAYLSGLESSMNAHCDHMRFSKSKAQAVLFENTDHLNLLLVELYMAGKDSGSGVRPYIKHWLMRQDIWEPDHQEKGGAARDYASVQVTGFSSLRKTEDGGYSREIKSV